MRRADRLFEIIQFMRRKALVRARDLAQALEVSTATVERDWAVAKAWLYQRLKV